MPQLQNLVLTDRAATPVAHTYVPRDIVTGVATVVESTGIPLADNRVSIGLARTSTGRFKATLKFAIPQVQTQTINGVSAPVIVRTAYADLTFTFDEKSTEQERKDIVGLVETALQPSKTLVNDTLTKLQGIY